MMETATRLAFGAACAILMLVSLMLSLYGIFTVIHSLTSPFDRIGLALLEAVGYVVISIAVFDVAKYFIEEEVIRGREMRLASEARRSLTKFVSTIIIAVFIEGLVQVFSATKEDAPQTLFPGFLLIVGVISLLGLGAYQWLSASVEERVEAKDQAQERSDSTNRKIRERKSR
jgi:hypothetical protein